MRISTTNFLGRLYRLNFDLSMREYGMPCHTNLCHFMRVILIWLPLKIGAAAGLIAAGWVWWEASATVGVAVICAVILLVVIILIAEYIWPSVRKLGDIENVAIMAEYVKAKKQKICPLVEIVEEE